MAKLPDGFVFIVEPIRTSVTLRQQDLIMCRSCTFHRAGANELEAWSDCCLHSMHVSENDWCSWAVKKKVTGDASI